MPTASACGTGWGSLANKTVTTHTYTGLTNNGYYCFRVRTVNAHPTTPTSAYVTVGPVREN